MKRLLLFVLLDIVVGGATFWISIEWITWVVFGWDSFILTLPGVAIVFSCLIVCYYVRKNESIWFFPLSHFVCFIVLSILFGFIGISSQKPSGYVDFSGILSVGFQAVIMLFWLIPAVIAAFVNDRIISYKKKKAAKLLASGNCEAESAPDEASPPEGGQPGPGTIASFEDGET